MGRIILIIISILGLLGSILYVVIFENNFDNNLGYQILKYPEFAPVVGIISLVILCFASSFGKKKQKK